MAPQDAFNPLRVVTQRLSSTPSRQLSHVVPYLANTIAQCGQAFTVPTKEGQVVGGSENAVLVHKLKTQLSALLQAKGLEARYAAVILIKATVEVGGWSILQGSGAWVRGLTSVLGVSNPSGWILNLPSFGSIMLSLDALYVSMLSHLADFDIYSRSPTFQVPRSSALSL